MKEKYKQWIYKDVKVSSCCESDLIYNGFVGLVDYGYKCGRCDRNCKEKTINKKVLE